MSRPTILIVDDEIIIARELESRLKTLGYGVPAIAASGAEAIAHAERYRPDLVLMDIVLKGDMDGIDAAREIRRRLQIPVIFLTAYTDPTTLSRAKVTEPSGYIVKPFSERELNANIEMALYKHDVERRLRKLELWFTHTMEVVGDAVVASDLEGQITVFNQAAETITSIRREEALGRPLVDVIRLAERGDGSPIEVCSTQNGPIVHLSGDTVLLGRDGRKLPVDVSISCMRDAYGEPTGTVSVLRDALGLERGVLAALNSDVALAAAQSATLQGMLQRCAESVVRNLNAAFARIWTVGSRKDVLVLQASAGMYTHLDGPHARIPLGKLKIGLIAANRTSHVSNTVLEDASITDPEWARREGMVAFAGYPLMIGDDVLGVMALFARQRLSESILSALESVSRMISIGVERKRLEEQLRQSQKLEAIGQLAGGMAHDFNNILTVISGCTQLLEASNRLGDDERALVDSIAQASQRAGALTRQLLAFSRKQVLEPSVVDLNALVLNMQQMLGRLIGEDVRLTTALEPKPVFITADPGQIEQVIANLVVNGRDAMPHGGQLCIETRTMDADETFSRMYPQITSSHVALLSVSDTGEGMSSEVAARAFEPFFTTKGPGKGTGLGLATVYGIVSQSGGHINIYSELGIGTVVKVFLPATTHAAPKQAEREPARELPRGTETLLVAEDEDAVRALVCQVLRASGYQVLEAGNGLEALQLAQRHHGFIHLLITDVVMPEMAGRVLSERLVDMRPSIRVLYMSGYTDDAVIRHGVLERGAAFLQKPFTPTMLAKKVRETLDAEPSGAPDA